MIGAPNSLNLNCKVCVMKEAPGPSVSEEIADIFTNYNIDSNAGQQEMCKMTSCDEFAGRFKLDNVRFNDGIWSFHWLIWADEGSVKFTIKLRLL